MLELIQNLTVKIKEREIIEGSAEIKDQVLIGYMVTLTRLLQAIPEQKLPIGKLLTEYLVHQCLFETPMAHKSSQDNLKSAPKCKNSKTREHAFNLLAVLSRDCIDNLTIVLDYLKQFGLKSDWRTNKDNDWKIKLLDDEKSSTGYVGIKNLGTICYMNSINQQLFMIPGFRNDVLSIKDPNNGKDTDEDNMFLNW